MKETKFKPGDRVRVRRDLRENKDYYMENSNNHDTVASEMLPFTGKVVTISRIATNRKYIIEEDMQEWGWTDEMFEEIAPEYVECIKSVHGNSRLKVGEIIKSEGDGYLPGICSYGSNTYLTCFKPSTEEAYEAQFKPKFKVGQWYKCSKGYFGKFLKSTKDTEFYASEHYLFDYKELDRYPFNNGYNWKEATNEEIQFFLPEGHPEKKFTFIKDEYYTSFYRGKLWQIFIYKKHLGERGCETGHYISTTSYCYFGPTYSTTLGLSDYVTHRLSTPEEKQWLDACVKAKTYLTKEQALQPKKWEVGTYVVFLKGYGRSNVGNIDIIDKTFVENKRIFLHCKKEEITTTEDDYVKWFATLAEAEAFSKELPTPKITVESEMKRLNWTVGEEFTVKDEPIKDAYYDGCNTETASGIRGITSTVKGGILVKGRLYLKIMESIGYAILAEAVIKKPKRFKLGEYEVVVSSTTVKIGCTSLPRKEAVAFLTNFVQFANMFADSGNKIVLAFTTIDITIAREFLEYINKH